ncbi:hypothetical protein QS713_03805 [Gleimia hominis]|uniref:DUF2207 domain-containing protein n=1 Tax=Gleimia hominis TaxID=595468 RepID=A0ABU3I9Z2_9ACTO|nr:hypothetical protein [Gleimia hominis]MDT3767191.1 hypothetical protein [Gleimia hominis]
MSGSDRGVYSPPQSSSTPSVVVYDFDSVRQASLWRSLGAAEATAQLNAALRTAVLLGDHISLDRNQLFDGIFFLTQGPEGIAFELGLGPNDRIPITVNCQPAPGGAGAVDLGFQLEKVRSAEFRAASSAIMATTRAHQPHDWQWAPRGPNWYPGAGLAFPANGLNGQDQHEGLDRFEVVALLERAQDKWVQAILDGRVRVALWKSGGLDMASALGDAQADLEARGEVPLLARYLFDNPGLTARKSVTALVTTLLPKLGLSETHGRAGMEMWSRAYYRAIAQRGSSTYLTFYDQEESLGADLDLARAYGLVLPVRSRFERLRDRTFTPARASKLRVEGEILDHMRVIAPPLFAQLHEVTREQAQALFLEGQSGAMFSIALAARELVGQKQSHQRKKRVTLLRMAIMTTIVLFVAFLGLYTDSVNLSAVTRGTLLVLAAVLGAVSSMPWDDIAQMWQLRKSSMTATLSMVQTE